MHPTPQVNATEVFPMSVHPEETIHDEGCWTRAGVLLRPRAQCLRVGVLQPQYEVHHMRSITGSPWPAATKKKFNCRLSKRHRVKKQNTKF